MKKKKNKRKKIKFQLREFCKKYGFIYIFWKMEKNGNVYIFLPSGKILEIVIRYYNFRKTMNMLDVILAIGKNSNWDNDWEYNIRNYIYTPYETYIASQNTVFSRKKQKEILCHFVENHCYPAYFLREKRKNDFSKLDNSRKEKENE